MSKKVNSTTNLPDGWRWVKLGEVCEEKTVTRDPRLQPTDTFRYVDISSVDNTQKRILAASVLFGKEAPSRARQVINAGDVIVSTTRPNLNAVALVPQDLDNQICSTGFCVLRPKKELERGYLFAYVCSPDFVKNLSDLVKGALYPAVTDKQVKAQVIPLPPLHEQKRIAAILNEQMAAVEKVRTAAEAQREAAKALPAAYLRKVFKYRTGDKLPEGWRWERLEEVCRVVSGSTPATAIEDFWNGDICWITPTDLGKLVEKKICSSSRYISKAGYDSCGTELIPPGSVVISSRAPIGHLGIAKVPLCTNQGCKSFIPTESIDSDYLYFALKKSVPILQSLGSGATFTEISKSQLKGFKIPIPPLPEQKRLAAILNEQMAEAEKLKESVDEQLNTTKSLPSALLRQAFSGAL